MSGSETQRVGPVLRRIKGRERAHINRFVGMARGFNGVSV